MSNEQFKQNLISFLVIFVIFIIGYMRWKHLTIKELIQELRGINGRN